MRSPIAWWIPGIVCDRTPRNYSSEPARVDRPMSVDHVVNFPPTQLDPEEAIRRQHVEAERLSRLAPGEYPLWIDRSAAQLGVSRVTLEAAVKAILAEREKKAQQAKREKDRADKAAERKRQEKRKQKDREFKVLVELPEREQDARLDSLAKRLDEDPAVVREEFATSLPPDPASVELWPDPVETAALLLELIRQFQRFIVFRHDSDATAVALWVMLSWIITSRSKPRCCNCG